MRIDLLKEFIALSRNLNFSKTAEEMFITQSVLSKHIAALEEEVGASLFTRSHHHLELTVIGRILLTEANIIVNQYDESMKKVKMAVAGLEMELRIGYLHAHTREILGPSAQLFEQACPHVKLTLLSCDYGDLPQKLKSNEVDVIITLDFDQELLSSWCDTYKLYPDVLRVAVSKNHPMARKKSVAIDELFSQRILLPANDKFNGYATYMNKVFNAEKIPPNKMLRYECISSSLLMAEAGDGVAIIPGKLKFYANDRIRCIPLKGDQYRFDVIAACRKEDKSPPIRKFIQALTGSQQMKEG